MNKPFFSIIIPTYNRAYLLSKAIESVIGQTFTNWELLIIDDGSTDNTNELVKSFTDSRIRYIWQENQERSAARNNGIKQAKGDYICFLDSDDYFLQNHLEVFYADIENKKFPVAMFYIQPAIIQTRPYNVFERILKSMITSQESCIHKEIFSKYQYNIELHISEDLELWMRIALDYPVYHIENKTIIIVNHDQRTVSFNNNNSFKNGLKVFRYIFKDERWKGKISRYVRKTIISDCYFGIARFYIFHKMKMKACFYIIFSIFIYPSRQFLHKIYTLATCNKMISKLLNLTHEY
jgi:glycosyltransferase involved in cell wall biosynthesis